MASVVISGDTSGSVTLSAPAVAGTTTLTLPSTSGTVLTTASTTGISGSAISTGTVAEAYGGTGGNYGWNDFKNRIINGGMVIDQRNAGAATANTISGYTLDRWQVLQSTTGKLIVQQNAGAVTPPAGFTNYLGITSQSAYSVGSSDYFLLTQYVEGYNMADFAWGTASAQTVTLSFWVRSSLTGTFGGALINGAYAYTYPFTYTISSANTWEQKTITITGPTAGTWLTTNGTGIQARFLLGAGSTQVSSTINQWVSSGYQGPTGATSVVGTNGATFYITGVQLEKGSTATSFDYRPYGTELALCQRYCFVPASNSRYVGQCDATTRALIIYVFPQTMRSGGTATLASATTYNVTTAAGGTIAGTSVSLSGAYTDTAQVAISVASGLVAGNATLVTASGTTIFSAEF